MLDSACNSTPFEGYFQVPNVCSGTGQLYTCSSSSRMYQIITR